MRLRYLDWDETIVKHIARHNITPNEVEEAFEGKHLVYKSRDGRYTLLGRSSAGRYLMIAFVVKVGIVHVITSRDMNRAEKKRYQ
ncbi:MAG: BrnT family toxin [Candidatus Omnitrophica bacterium]|nr:BrnT family toxin [Candidatus Omnitrophota bacterium]